MPSTGRGPEVWGSLRDPATGRLRFPHCNDPAQAPVALSSAGAAPGAGGAPVQLRRSAAGARNFSMAPRPDFHPGFEFRLRDSVDHALYPRWEVDGETYTFEEFHFHSPAEHTLDGVRHALELHFLFELVGPEEPPERAVMAILFPWEPHNPDNPFVSAFWSNICAWGGGAVDAAARPHTHTHTHTHARPPLFRAPLFDAPSPPLPCPAPQTSASRASWRAKWTWRA